MDVRTRYLVRGWSYALIACMFPLLAITGRIPDDRGYIMGGLFFVIMGTISFFAFKRARTTAPGTKVRYAPPPDAPVTEQLAFYRRYLIISLCGAPSAAAFSAWRLHPLTESNGATVHIWAPLAWVFAHFGYWAAVLVIPGIFVLCTIVLQRKIVRLRNGKVA